MKFAIAFLAVQALCVFASPAPHNPLLAQQQQSVVSTSSSSSTSINYFKSDTCSTQKIHIREDISTEIYKSSETIFYDARCRFLDLYSAFPVDYGQKLLSGNYQFDQYDVAVIGSSMASLSTLEYFLDLGYKVALFEAGGFLGPRAYSIQQRSFVYDSSYVRSYNGYVNGGSIQKRLFSVRAFSGFQMYGFNGLYTTPGFLLDQYYSSVNDAFTSQYAYERFSSYFQESSSFSSSSNSFQSSMSSSLSSSATSMSQSSSSSSYYNVFSSYRQSESVRFISNLAQELGYQTLTGNQFQQGLQIVPMFGSGNVAGSIANSLFRRLGSKTSNLHLFLNTEVNSFGYGSGSISSLELLTASQQTISFSNFKHCICGLNPYSLYPLLFRSGVGPASILGPRGINPLVTLPDTMNQLYQQYMYTGLLFSLKQYSISNYYSDSFTQKFALADYSLDSMSSTYYYQFLINTGNSPYPTVRVRFCFFSSLMTNYFQSYGTNILQYDQSTLQYLSNTLQTNDILSVSLELLDIQSRITFDFDNSWNLTPQFNFFSTQYEQETIIEAISIVRSYLSTNAFSSYGAQILTPPLLDYNGPLDWSNNDYIKASLPYYATPFPSSPYGGLGYGDIINNNFRFNDINNFYLVGSSLARSALYSSNLATDMLFSSYFAQNFNSYISNSNSLITSNSAGLISSSSSSSSMSQQSSAMQASSSTLGGVGGGYGGSGYSSSSSMENSAYSSQSSQQNSLVAGGNGYGHGVVASQSAEQSSANYSSDKASSTVVNDGFGNSYAQSQSESVDYSAKQASQSSTVAAY